MNCTECGQPLNAVHLVDGCPPPSDDRFQMLYCDQAACRTNTFERGDGSDNVRGESGRCPGCGRVGEAVR